MPKMICINIENKIYFFHFNFLNNTFLQSEERCNGSRRADLQGRGGENEPRSRHEVPQRRNLRARRAHLQAEQRKEVLSGDIPNKAKQNKITFFKQNRVY
jgi:hypothetical protein